MSARTAGEWTAAITEALKARDVEVVPGLLTLMELDGHPVEAERLRVLMLMVVLG